MALSAMGSAGAWFAGYLKKDERSNNTSLRERLLDMMVAARRHRSAPDLCRQRHEAGDVLRGELHPDMRHQRVTAEGAEILVEVPEHG